MIFKKSETDNAVDLFEVEMGLKKAYQEVSSRNCDATVCLCQRMSSDFLYKEYKYAEFVAASTVLILVSCLLQLFTKLNF